MIGNGDKQIGLMNSFDGANHLVTNQGSVSIISFNIQLFSNEIIHNTSTTKSSNILTHMQAICKETWPNMKFLIEKHYKERKRVI